MTRALSRSCLAYGLLAGSIALLSGCGSNATLSPAAQQAIVNLCATDAALQPVAAGAVAGVGATTNPSVSSGVASAVSLDNSVLHPAVKDACAAVGTLPVTPTVTPAATPAPAAAPMPAAKTS
jgi:hypothetical protein